jgi:hypothetical protein
MPPKSAPRPARRTATARQAQALYTDGVAAPADPLCRHMCKDIRYNFRLTL